MTENVNNRKPNRLIKEKSPYLLQHAYNPVDWYTWSDEAFEKAKNEDKPVFLSIGYSTCHWCHVMETQSFEKEEVAGLLNASFVAIKVDREERPDVDHIYMQVCQALTGSGGWPLTIIMTPDRQPFYAATYLPPHSQGGLLGMMELLPRLSELWKNDRAKTLQVGQKVRSWMQQSGALRSGVKLSEATIHKSFHQFVMTFDPTFGGFGSAPKFPAPHNLMFLLKYYELYRDGQALEMVEKTLSSCYKGGIYDHIGFGFARYSTDNQWLVPHFEKMLYDNALLAMAYLAAYRITGQELFGQVAKDIFEYILRDMTAPEGGFYSAEDADSEGEEGKFYTWTWNEVMETLGEPGADYGIMYDITPGGNFEGRNIPNLIRTADPFEARKKSELERNQLFAIRDRRIKPLKDDKILTGWNGLMIAALAIGYGVIGDKKYLQAAQKAADFVLTQLRREDGRLLARYRDGEALYKAYASDYAYLIWGLIELNQADPDIRYLEAARELNDDLLKLFWDEEDGGLFFYGTDAEQLIVRPKEVYDGALPSDNAVATLNWLRLAGLDKNSNLAARAQAQFRYFAGDIAENPTACSFWLQAALYQQQTGMRISL
ncbi:MAG: thioredoxin domain-containing protein [Firmicutes bacterium]|nr:thioredoxin domain-containing protein [Bacillota bacterium]